MLKKKHILFFMLVIAAPFCYGVVSVKLKGLDEDLTYNVYKKLSQIDLNAMNILSRSNFQEKLDDIVRAGLRPLGYYTPTINFFLYR